MRKKIFYFLLLLNFSVVLFSCDDDVSYKPIAVETKEVISTDYESAVVTGKITEFGKGIDAFGHCWSTNPIPSITDDTTIIIKEVGGDYQSLILGLIDGEKYYIRSYALNKDEIVYGEIKDLTTIEYNLPEIKINSIYNISDSASNVEIELLNFGGTDSISDYGICWSESINPSINDNYISSGTTNELLKKEILLNLLEPGIKYYLRAFAKNKKGLNYSIEKEFETTNLTYGLIAYYPFYNNSNDYSGNENHATNFGAVIAIDRFENENSAYEFDGLTSYMQLTKDINSSNGLTFAFWINSRGAQLNENNGAIISKYDMGDGGQRNFYVGSFGDYEYNNINMIRSVFFAYSNSTTYNDRVYSNWTLETLPDGSVSSLWTFVNPMTITLNEWNFVVVNLTNNELELWLNGTITVKKTREYITYADNSDEPIFLGNMPNSGTGANNHFNGILDDFRIYNRGLTSDEIKSIYHQGGWDK